MFWCWCVYFEQVKYRNNESKQKQHEIIFWINYNKIYTKSEGLGVVNSIGLHGWTLALGGMKTKLVYLLDSGNNLRFKNVETDNFRKMDICILKYTA